MHSQYVGDSSDGMMPEYDFGWLRTRSGRNVDSSCLSYAATSLANRGVKPERASAILAAIASASGGDPFAMSPDGSKVGLLQTAGCKPNIFRDQFDEIDAQLDDILEDDSLDMRPVSETSALTADEILSMIYSPAEVREGWPQVGNTFARGGQIYDGETLKPDKGVTIDDNTAESMSAKTGYDYDAFNDIINTLELKDGHPSHMDGRYYPYKVQNETALTIGHGLRLDYNPDVKEIYDKQGYLTDEQESYFIRSRAKDAFSSAKSIFDRNYPESFDRLDPRLQTMLAYYCYNLGPKNFAKYKNFMRGVYENDIDLMLKEYIRNQTLPDGTKIPLGEGNDYFREYLINYRDNPTVRQPGPDAVTDIYKPAYRYDDSNYLDDAYGQYMWP